MLGAVICMRSVLKLYSESHRDNLTIRLRYSWVLKNPLIPYGTLVCYINYLNYIFFASLIKLIGSFHSQTKFRVSVEGEVCTPKDLIEPADKSGERPQTSLSQERFVNSEECIGFNFSACAAVHASRESGVILGAQKVDAVFEHSVSARMFHE
jgi:hypothetical protein